MASPLANASTMQGQSRASGREERDDGIGTWTVQGHVFSCFLPDSGPRRSRRVGLEGDLIKQHGGARRLGRYTAERLVHTLSRDAQACPDPTPSGPFVRQSTIPCRKTGIPRVPCFAIWLSHTGTNVFRLPSLASTIWTDWYLSCVAVLSSTFRVHQRAKQASSIPVLFYLAPDQSLYQSWSLHATLQYSGHTGPLPY